MADWTGVDSNSLLPGKPVTSSIMLAAFEDPIAIAEGAVGAPRIARKIIVGSATGGTSASVTFTDLDDWGGVLTSEFNAFGSSDLTVEFSNDGSTFSASTSFPVGTSFFSIDFTSGAYLAASSSGVTSGTISGIPSGVTDFKITSTDPAGPGQNSDIFVAIELTGGDTTS